jgi:hypothetical protein
LPTRLSTLHASPEVRYGHSSDFTRDLASKLITADHGRAMAVPDIWATANSQHDRGEVASEYSGEDEDESEDEEASDGDEVQEKVCSKDGVLLTF